MNAIDFHKMSGSGNDFILVDNRDETIPPSRMPDLARKLCARRMSIGADGMIFIEKTDGADFRWRFFNADGTLADMCGNGARCAARYAFIQGIAPQAMTFETGAGLIRAHIESDRVRIGLTEPWVDEAIRELNVNGAAIRYIQADTGVPHVVIPVADVRDVDVRNLGRTIRHHFAFKPLGTNVNFSSVTADGRLAVRTYERGVEDETLACGTGSVAAVLAWATRSGVDSPVSVVPKSGETLQISFSRRNGGFHDIALTGNARIVCAGRILPDAWEWGD